MFKLDKIAHLLFSGFLALALLVLGTHIVGAFFIPLAGGAAYEMWRGKTENGRQIFSRDSISDMVFNALGVGVAMIVWYYKA